MSKPKHAHQRASIKWSKSKHIYACRVKRSSELDKALEAYMETEKDVSKLIIKLLNEHFEIEEI